jgi:hypothetical protein
MIDEAGEPEDREFYVDSVMERSRWNQDNEEALKTWMNAANAGLTRSRGQGL